MPLYYILKNREAIPCDVMTWTETIESQNRDVAKTDIGMPQWKIWIGKWLKIKKFEPVWVSTVFLGLNQNWGSDPPLLFETMVFGGEHDGERKRYSTWEEAEQGHKKICESVLR